MPLSITRDSDFLHGYDFQAHNEETQTVWSAYHSRKPIRVPVLLGLNARYFLNHPNANPRGLNFRDYSADPKTMFDFQLEFLRWRNCNLLHDIELGIPTDWMVYVDFQNYSESAWFGCPIVFLEDQVPDTRPVYEENPESIMDHGIPDPFDGIYGKALEFYEYFKERASQETYYECPIQVAKPFIGTDGLLTISCNLFGPDFVLSTLATDPERMHKLFRFVQDATIERMKAWRRLTGTPIPEEHFGFCDDSIALISTRMYQEHILPYHKELCTIFGQGKGDWIHLCGDATRHFKCLHEEVGMIGFDTGFPVDFGNLRSQLGPEVEILGGPHVEVLRTGTPEQVRLECQRILQSGIMQGGRFILREGNNLAPGTPVENVAAMFQAAKEFGVYPRS